MIIVGYSRAAVGGGGTTYYDVAIAKGAVHHWRLNEASGVLEDSVSTNDFTITGSITYGVAGATGDGDDAISNAAAAYGDAAGWGSVPTGTSAVSWAAIVKTTVTTKQMIVSYGGNSTRAAIFFVINGSANPRLGVHAWADDQETTATGLNDGNWHHVAFTHAATSSAVKVYMDGSLLATLTYGGNLNTNSGGADPKLMGNFADLSNHRLNGSLDEVSVFATELSGTDISDLYDAIPNA